MEIEIRLKKILQQHHLDGFGITQRIADDLDVHRHVIGKLLRNKVTNPSLKVLGSVCEWLANHGVPPDSLPHALIGSKPSGLRQAMAQPDGVTLFVAEYRQMGPSRTMWRWIAQHDAVAMAKVVQFLSCPLDIAEPRLPVGIEYVPFRFVPGKLELRKDHLEEDVKRARKIYPVKRTADSARSSVLIGSQRVNHLVEFLVADIFGCTAFHRPKKTTRKVPFYLVYREDDLIVPSCFGGRKGPPGSRGAVEPGVYYCDKSGKWVACPWIQDQQDVGVVIILRDPGTALLDMAMFGFSGRGTEALGTVLLREPGRFWPLDKHPGGKEVSVFICRFTLDHDDSSDGSDEVRAADVDVIRLDNDILARHLR